MMHTMETLVLIIAAGTFLVLAFLPLMFTRKEHAFERITLFSCGGLSLILLPSLYYTWITGLALAIMAWAGCWVMAYLSNTRSTIVLRSMRAKRSRRKREVKEEHTTHDEISHLASALDKIQVLERLAKMKAEGVISGEEFNAEKRRIFG